MGIYQLDSNVSIVKGKLARLTINAIKISQERAKVAPVLPQMKYNLPRNRAKFPKDKNFLLTEGNYNKLCQLSSLFSNLRTIDPVKVLIRFPGKNKVEVGDMRKLSIDNRKRKRTKIVQNKIRT